MPAVTISRPLKTIQMCTSFSLKSPSYYNYYDYYYIFLCILLVTTGAHYRHSLGSCRRRCSRMWYRNVSIKFVLIVTRIIFAIFSKPTHTHTHRHLLVVSREQMKRYYAVSGLLNINSCHLHRQSLSYNPFPHCKCSTRCYTSKEGFSMELIGR